MGYNGNDKMSSDATASYSFLSKVRPISINVTIYEFFHRDQKQRTILRGLALDGGIQRVTICGSVSNSVNYFRSTSRVGGALQSLVTHFCVRFLQITQYNIHRFCTRNIFIIEPNR